MNENQGPIQQVPNELGVPDADNSNVVESAPVDTSTPDDTTAPEAEDTQPEAAPAEATEAPAEEATAETTQVEEDELSLPTIDNIKAINEANEYQPTEVELDITDEYGNLDPKKFQAFMAQNNQQVRDQTLAAMQKRDSAMAAEDAAWEKVYEAYPEIKDNNLDNALRGARIQDITAGGDGDLARLARELAAPFRQAKIDATEKANKTVEEAESLETLTPTAATPPKEAPSLMTQLKTALAEGDTETANRVRHAIRKQRIHDTSS